MIGQALSSRNPPEISKIYVDHDEDPYNISKGFFWAHMGWLIFKLTPEPPMDNVNDLRKDQWVMWQHRHVQWIGLVVGIVIPSALGYGWNAWHGINPWTGALGGFLLAPRTNGPGPAQRASEALHEMVERLTANYHELEQAVAERVEVSRMALRTWRNETRDAMRQLSRMVAAPEM